MFSLVQSSTYPPVVLSVLSAGDLTIQHELLDFPCCVLAPVPVLGLASPPLGWSPALEAPLLVS